MRARFVFIRLLIAFVTAGMFFGAQGQIKKPVSGVNSDGKASPSQSARQELTRFLTLHSVSLPKSIDFPAPVERPTLASYFSGARKMPEGVLSEKTVAALRQALQAQFRQVQREQLKKLSEARDKAWDEMRSIQDGIYRVEMPKEFSKLEQARKQEGYSALLLEQEMRKADEEKMRTIERVSAVINAATVRLAVKGDPEGARSVALQCGDAVAANAFSAFADAYRSGIFTEQTLTDWARAADRLNPKVFLSVLKFLLREPNIRDDGAELLTQRWEKTPQEAETYRPVRLADLRPKDLPFLEMVSATGSSDPKPIAETNARELLFLRLFVSAAFQVAEWLEQEAASVSPMTPKSEFETQAQYEVRKKEFQQKAADHDVYLKSIRQLLFVRAMTAVFAKQAPWTLKNLAYDAEGEFFTGQIATQSPEVAIAVRFPAAREQAPKIKMDLWNKPVYVYWQAPLGGELRLRSVSVHGDVYSIVSLLDAGTGLRLDRSLIQTTEKLAAAVEEEERGAAEKMRVAEEKRREAEQRAEAERRAQAEKNRLAAMSPEERRLEDYARRMESAGGNCFLFANNLRGAINMYGVKHPIVGRHLEQARQANCLP